MACLVNAGFGERIVDGVWSKTGGLPCRGYFGILSFVFLTHGHRHRSEDTGRRVDGTWLRLYGIHLPWPRTSLVATTKARSLPTATTTYLQTSRCAD